MVMMQYVSRAACTAECQRAIADAAAITADCAQADMRVQVVISYSSAALKGLDGALQETSIQTCSALASSGIVLLHSGRRHDQCNPLRPLLSSY